MKIFIFTCYVIITVHARTVPIPVKPKGEKPVLPIVPIRRPTGSLIPRPIIPSLLTGAIVSIRPIFSIGSNVTSTIPFSSISETTVPSKTTTISGEKTLAIESSVIPVGQMTTVANEKPATSGPKSEKQTKAPVPDNLVKYSGCKPASCLEIKLSGGPNRPSGVYTIYPRQWFNVQPFDVYCDMETDGGGWTVIQRRGPYAVQENFDRNWTDYRNGFGDKSEDYWLGLEKIFLLTVQDQVTLRFDLHDKTGRRAHGIYRNFLLGNRDQKYAIYPADFRGTAGDPLWVAMPFTTRDDPSVKHECIKNFKGGWWLNDNCPPGEKMNNLNGHYGTTMIWKTWDADLEWTEIKIRPSYYTKCANGGSHYYFA